MCVLSIKVPIRKKSGNLFNDPRIKTLQEDILEDIKKSYFPFRSEKKTQSPRLIADVSLFKAAQEPKINRH